MAEIKLTSGDTVLISDCDFDRVSKYKWSYKKYKNQTYVRRSTAHGKPILLHHFIIGTPDKGKVVDHVNGNGMDNRRENLRFATRSQNAMNAKGKAGSKSPKGVSYCKTNKRYRARITLEGKTVFLGFHDTKKKAVNAYKKAAFHYFGEFANA